MGSFANSLHIKSARAEEVSDAIRAILLDAGYQVTSAPSPKPRIVNDALEQHAEHLRPLLGADVGQDRVLEVLGKQAVFAEHVLGEFMKLLGIQPFFANLSYRYLEECSVAELLAADIKLIDHLKFKRPSERRFGIFRPS
jgi:hypothetical protein